jgi:hypothetical protein
MRLHLGCGEVHLDGYLNIDYPLSSHPVQKISAADEYHNILELSYPANSIEEIRLHHVFEHFSRATSIALLAGWWLWLSVDGLLRIEVPDFQHAAMAVVNPFSRKKARYVGLRHIFGSQEASWAVHMEGWSAQSMRDVLSLFGYKVEDVKHNHWRGTYNIEVFARKMFAKKTFADFEQVARTWLTQFTVDNGESERKMLEVWMNQYRDQVRSTQL